MPEMSEKAKKSWVLALASVASCMVALDALVVTTALSAIRLELDASIVALEWTVNAYNLSFAVLLLTGTALGDRFGRRRMFAHGIGLFAAASAACALASSVGWLIAARAVQGAGAALVVPLAMALLSAAFPREERGRALGLFSGITGVALIAGPVVGGAIVQGLAWQWIFWINLPIAALGLVLATLFIPDVFGEEITRFDFSGFLFSGLGLSALVSASAALDANVVSPLLVVSLLVVGLAGIGLYVWHARRTTAPLLDLELLRYPTFRAGAVGGSLFRVGVGAVPLLLPLLLQLGFGFSPLRSGLLTFVTALGAIGMKIAASRILRQWGFRRVLIFNSIVSAVFIAAPAVFTPEMSMPLMIVVLFIGGFFRSLEFTCINAISYAEIDQSKMSAATSLQSVLQQFSLSMGVTVGASILQLALALGGSSTLRASDFWPAFLVIGAISFLATFSFARLPEYAGEELAGRKRTGSVQVNISNVRS